MSSFTLSGSFFILRVLTALPCWLSSLTSVGSLSECNNSRRNSSADSSAFRFPASEWTLRTCFFKSSFLEYVLWQYRHWTRCSEVPQRFLWRKKFPLFLIVFPHVGQARGYVALHMIDLYTRTQWSQMIFHGWYPSFIPVLVKRMTSSSKNRNNFCWISKSVGDVTVACRTLTCFITISTQLWLQARIS